MTPDWTKRLAESVDRQNKFLETEMRRLADNPGVYDIATALTDALMSSTDRLCNFDHFVDHNGRRHETSEVAHALGDDVRAEFLRLTGRPYVPKICRVIEDARKENQT